MADFNGSQTRIEEIESEFHQKLDQTTANWDRSISDLQENLSNISSQFQYQSSQHALIQKQLQQIRIHLQGIGNSFVTDSPVPMQQPSNSLPPGNNSFPTRFKQIELPIFEGDDVFGWIYKCEMYFTLNMTPDHQKVELASSHFGGRAYIWHHTVQNSRSLQYYFHSWNSYAKYIFIRFGGYEKDPMPELMEMKERLPVEDYIAYLELRLIPKQEREEKLGANEFNSGEGIEVRSAHDHSGDHSHNLELGIIEVVEEDISDTAKKVIIEVHTGFGLEDVCVGSSFNVSSAMEGKNAKDLDKDARDIMKGRCEELMQFNNSDPVQDNNLLFHLEKLAASIPGIHGAEFALIYRGTVPIAAENEDSKVNRKHLVVYDEQFHLKLVTHLSYNEPHDERDELGDFNSAYTRNFHQHPKHIGLEPYEFTWIKNPMGYELEGQYHNGNGAQYFSFISENSQNEACVLRFDFIKMTENYDQMDISKPWHYEVRKILGKFMIIIWGWYYKDIDIFFDEIVEDFKLKQSQSSLVVIHPGSWNREWKIAWHKSLGTQQNLAYVDWS